MAELEKITLVRWVYGEEESRLFIEDEYNRRYTYPFFAYIILFVILMLLCVGAIAWYVVKRDIVGMYVFGGLVITGLLVYMRSMGFNLKRVNNLIAGLHELVITTEGLWQDSSKISFSYFTWSALKPGNPMVFELFYRLTRYRRSPLYQLRLPVPVGKESEAEQLVEALNAFINGDNAEGLDLARLLPSNRVNTPPTEEPPQPGLDKRRNYVSKPNERAKETSRAIGSGEGEENKPKARMSKRSKLP
jgi:hypothetical protein